ncbi:MULTISPECIES: fimbrial protein [Pseudomonadota]|uniref:fimbrial protein n=1 Tax=Pseudomonadota TaxID=1224 RepID=UPI0009F62F8B|nr:MULTISPECIES: fimbrial protein [Pseudomonadota]MBJ9965612.1 type 1 fimbrial protein [Burkholderia seminalis]MDN7586825.1 fimbrial protein [Burkholderia seminalis]
MKQMLLPAVLAAVCAVSTLGVSSAQAADGTITFNGKISAASCVIDGTSGASGTNGAITVAMGTVSTQALQAANSTAGQTPFALKLSGANCTNGQTAAMWVETASTAALDTTTNNLKNQAVGGSNVQVQLLNGNTNQQIKLGQPAVVTTGATVLSNNQPAATIAGNTATLKYIAQYVNTGAAGSVTAGNVQTALTYSMQYN